MSLGDIFDPAELTLAELIIAVAIVFVAGILAGVARRRIRSYLERQDGLDDYLAPLLGRIAGWAIMIVGLLIALVVLGLDMAPVVLILLIVLAIVVLSGRGILENFASGLVLQIRGPFRPGDRIDVVGFDGVDKEINARAVVIETPDNRSVHIPNTDVLNSPIMNHTELPMRRSDVIVGIGYDEDIDRARTSALDALGSIEVILDDPPPEVLVSELGDSSVDLIVRFWHGDDARITARAEAIEAVKRAFDEAGIEIPFPQRTVWVRREHGGSDAGDGTDDTERQDDPLGADT